MFIVFWITFIVICYHYFIFPVYTIVLATLAKKTVKKNNITPKVSLIVAAYNEEKVIAAKMKNSFLLDYPSELLEIIVVSDGSTDSTPQLVKQYSEKGVVSLHDPPRRGKTSALNRAVAEASGDIILFSDANSMYDPQTVKMLVRNFADPSVGGACGRKTIITNVEREASRGDSLFWTYESYLKIQQSLTGSITTGDGEIFAIRRELYTHIPEKIINDDTAITFNIISAGLRVVYEPEAISNEEASIVLEDDFNVKVRMVSGGYQTVASYFKMLLPPRNYFSIQFFSHKILRWGMPFLLIAILGSNLFLLEGYYLYFLWVQLACYLLALFGYFMKLMGLRVSKVFYVPMYYCTMNIAAFLGFIAYLRGTTGVVIWKKAER